MDIVRINSIDRNANFSLSNAQYNLTKAVAGRYYVRQFSMLNTFYNVDSNNSKIYFYDGAARTGTIADGYYYIDDIGAAIVTAMNAVSAHTFTVAIADNTGLMTVTDGTGSFHFTWASNTSNTARRLMGFEATDGTDAATQTGTLPVNLGPNREIYCVVSQNKLSGSIATRQFQTSFMIPNVCGFQDVLRKDNSQSRMPEIIELDHTAMLDISFRNEFGQELTIRSDYMLELYRIIDNKAHAQHSANKFQSRE